jgi:DNA-binding NarL/FixJ family response regulator
MIHVMIADDNDYVRRSLRSILETTPDMRVTSEAASCSTLIETLRFKNEADVLLLDISMQGESGIAVISEIRVLRPDLRILVLSGYESGVYASQALKAGSNGYAEKTSSPEELIRAIRMVYNGEEYVPPIRTQRDIELM